MRKSWDEYFINIAEMVAERGTCDRAKVGCVVVQNNHIKSTGYNGSPPGLPHCESDGHEMVGNHCVRTIHAEINALLRSGYVENGVLYVTHFPCYTCSKILISMGIRRVVYIYDYRQDELALKWLQESNVEIVKWK
jgi:dCMP deaminase